MCYRNNVHEQVASSYRRTRYFLAVPYDVRYLKTYDRLQRTQHSVRHCGLLCLHFRNNSLVDPWFLSNCIVINLTVYSLKLCWIFDYLIFACYWYVFEHLLLVVVSLLWHALTLTICNIMIVWVFKSFALFCLLLKRVRNRTKTSGQ